MKGTNLFNKQQKVKFDKIKKILFKNNKNRNKTNNI